MSEKLFFSGTWTGDLTIFILDELTSAPSRQAIKSPVLSQEDLEGLEYSR